VGISCDSDPAKLVEYGKKNELPWIQMWDKKAQVNDNDDAWHPLAKSWGVMAIPQMFLIDRKGNLRTVNARENMDELIPQLLKEKE
jgi:peroxiredoxin